MPSSRSVLLKFSAAVRCLPAKIRLLCGKVKVECLSSVNRIAQCAMFASGEMLKLNVGPDRVAK